MTFFQMMEFSTTDETAMRAEADRWADDAINAGTATRGILAADRSTPGRYVWLALFDSAEDAAKNNERPETGAHAEAFGALTTDGISFREFDIVSLQGS